MTDYENKLDKLLKISTVGRDDSKSDEYRYPYEPTPYSVLERLADSGLISENDTVLDYGCGKGRVSFFLSHRLKANAIGIEYDERIYKCALENRKTSAVKAEFVLLKAEEYEVPPDVKHCYFFNPFSEEILHKVISRILDSYYANPREMFLFFYFPSDAYISALMCIDALEFYDEIECDDLFESNRQRERIMIFQLPN